MDNSKSEQFGSYPQPKKEGSYPQVKNSIIARRFNVGKSRDRVNEMLEKSRNRKIQV